MLKSPGGPGGLGWVRHGVLSPTEPHCANLSPGSAWEKVPERKAWGEAFPSSIKDSPTLVLAACLAVPKAFHFQSCHHGPLTACSWRSPSPWSAVMALPQLYSRGWRDEGEGREAKTVRLVRTWAFDSCPNSPKQLELVMEETRRIQVRTQSTLLCPEVSIYTWFQRDQCGRGSSDPPWWGGWWAP